MGSIKVCRRCKRVALVPEGRSEILCTFCSPESYDWVDGEPRWKR